MPRQQVETSRTGKPSTQPARSSRRRGAERVARLVARLYAGGSELLRTRVLECLLRPLGPLGVAAVASGAFLGHLLRNRHGAIQVDVHLAVQHSAAQVFELARFAEQVDPDVLRHVSAALASVPLGSVGLSAAALLIVLG